jgi:ADP-ribose pyrophosphatase YjhB (NUDIX family)
MACNTQKILLPNGNAPLRCNVLPALFDLNTAKIFVGELKPRTDQVEKRRYSWSMVEGGVDVGETPADAACRELNEEVGVTNPTLLTFARAPLMYCFEDGKAPGARYSGKLYLLGACGVRDSSAINLRSGADSEGDTFISGDWLPLSKAEEALLKNTTSEPRRQFIRDTTALLRPVEQTLLSLRGRGVSPKVSAQQFYEALPPEVAMHYTDHAPSRFPVPSSDDLRLGLQPVRPLVLGVAGQPMSGATPLTLVH